MEIFDGEIVVVPMVRIVFDDPLEFFQFQSLACHLGKGEDWPISMLRDYLESYKDSAQVGDKPFSFS